MNNIIQETLVDIPYSYGEVSYYPSVQGVELYEIERIDLSYNIGDGLILAIQASLDGEDYFDISQTFSHVNEYTYAGNLNGIAGRVSTTNTNYRFFRIKAIRNGQHDTHIRLALTRYERYSYQTQYVSIYNYTDANKYIGTKYNECNQYNGYINHPNFGPDKDDKSFWTLYNKLYGIKSKEKVKVREEEEEEML